jgi:hypothetical protein
MDMEATPAEQGVPTQAPQDTSGSAHDTKRSKQPSEEDREARRLALLNPAFMRAQEYESFRKYGETYVTAPDSYARPQLPIETVERIIAIGLTSLLGASGESNAGAIPDETSSEG